MTAVVALELAHPAMCRVFIATVSYRPKAFDRVLPVHVAPTVAPADFVEGSPKQPIVLTITGDA